MGPFYRLVFISSLIAILNISNAAIVEQDDYPVAGTMTGAEPGSITSSSVTTGYRALKLFLENEQHLTLVRRATMVITFKDISDGASSLVDEIAESSAKALEELETLEKARPQIVLEDFPDDTIGKATFDSLRMASAKEFLFDIDNFEKNLLLSQLKVLPVISHLAMQLEQKESNQKRKLWLSKLADRYEKHYQQVNKRFIISSNPTTMN